MSRPINRPDGRGGSSDEVAVDVERYLARIGHHGPVGVDLHTLTALQRAHLTAVPFENLNVYFGVGVSTDVASSLSKIVEQGRGGWCFENNGAFGALLEAIGFDVTRLGAAVLLGGPSDMIGHLALEVKLDRAWLVDVGFDAAGPIIPLAINERGPQDGGNGTFEFIPSDKGLTITRHDDDGVPMPQYRFRRVAHQMSDFEAASQFLQHDERSPFLRGPFANRLLDGGPDRVTVTPERLRVVRGGEVVDTTLGGGDWPTTLHDWFGMHPPEPPAG